MKKKEKKAEEMAAINNSKAVHHLYGTAHILKVEVMIQFQNNPSLNSFFYKGGEDRRGEEDVHEEDVREAGGRTGQFCY